MSHRAELYEITTKSAGTCVAFGKRRWHGTTIATLVTNPVDRNDTEREI